MKQFKKFMTVFLAIIMCMSNVLSVSAVDTGGSGATGESGVIFTEDFEGTDGLAQFNPNCNGYEGDNTIKLAEGDTEHGQVVEFKRASGKTNAFHMEASGSFGGKAVADSIVYEFEVKLIPTMDDNEQETLNGTYLRVLLGGNSYFVCAIKDGNLLVRKGDGAIANGAVAKSLEGNTWYKIAVVQNYAEGTRDIYIDGVKAEDGTTSLEANASNAVFSTMRFRCDGGTTDHVMIDNVKVYEGTKPAIDYIFEEDFEGTDGLAQFNPNCNTYDGDNTIKLAEGDAEHGQVVEFKRASGKTNAFHMEASGSFGGKAVADSIVYEFDAKLIPTMDDNEQETLNGTYLRVLLGGNSYFVCAIKDGNLLVRKGDGAIANGEVAKSLEGNTWYKIAVVQNYAEGTRDIYIDGVKAEDATTSLEANASNAVFSTMRFRCDGGTTDHVMIDNVKVYKGTKPTVIVESTVTPEPTAAPGTSPEPTVTPGATAEPTATPEATQTPTNILRDPEEGTKIFAADFEAYNPLKPITNGGIINSVADDADHGQVVELQRTQSGNLKLEERSTPVKFSTDANSVVYEFDVKLKNPTTTSFSLTLRKQMNGASTYSYVCTIDNGVLKARDGNEAKADFDQLGTLSGDTWYKVTVVQNYKTGYRDVYLNGTMVSTAETLDIETAFMDGVGTVNLDVAAFECRSVDTYSDDYADLFRLDNVRVYEGTRPHTDLIEKEVGMVDITIDPNTFIFSEAMLEGLYDTSSFDTLLNGYVALHTRSGLVYKDGTKKMLVTTPVETGTGYMVVLNEICQALGVTPEINGSTATINGKAVAVTEKDGKQWVDAEAFLGVFGTVYVDTNASIKSSGMMIAGAEGFTWPSDVMDTDAVLNAVKSRSMLQNLNDFLFFEQPTVSQVKELFGSANMAGVHPRIQVSKADFDRIKEEVTINSLMNTWYQQLIAAADYLVNTNTTPLTYTFTNNTLLQVSRDMLDHMYTLGMAYQLTGEPKYVNRAWIDLEAVSQFQDWHPQHNLDTAEMSAAVAIGYDWMYYGLSDNQRETIEKGMWNNGLAAACEAYKSWGGYFTGAVIQSGNQNVVVNGGFAMAALAFMDVNDKYEKVCSYITSGAIRGAGVMLLEYGPDGAWKEGPNYWEYTTQYTSKLFSTLDNVFGTCFNLDKCDGLDTAANYILDVQSDRGLFDYGDSSPSQYYVPEVFYLSNKYGDENLTSALLNLNHGEMKDCENVVLSLMWYNTNIEEGDCKMPLGSAYNTEGVASFRDKWTDGATTYVGIHGGKTNITHAQLDGGTFVYDYAGIRWAKEIGRTPYYTSVNSDISATGGRWLLYRSKAEAHNTIVINPVDKTTDQVVESTARLTKFENKTKGGIAVLDMTENYANNASSAIRGYFFTDDRTSLVIRDEITLKTDNSTVYWFMHTDADVEIAADGKSAILMQDGKQVILEFVTTGNGSAELSYGPSTRALLGTTSPLAGTSEVSEDVENPDVNRIYIKLSGASGDVTITVKLTPANVNSTPVSDYNKSIASWTIPDGEIAANPEIQSVVIDGREIVFDDANKATFLCVEGKYDSVPVPTVTIDESKFNYEITNATTTDSGVTTILVKDKTNANVMTAYTIAFEEIPTAAVPTGFTGNALQVVAVEASDEPQAVPEGYVAWKVLDQNTDSRWTSQGIGHWILLELEEEATVDDLIILFKNGHKRATYFNVSVSTDNETFEMIYSGESGGTKIGNAEAYEQIPLGGKAAKYIKIGCNGNSAQGVVAGWNNIGEVVFIGTVNESEPTPTPTVAPTATPAPSAEPTSTPAPSTEPTTSPVPETVEIVADKTDESYTLGTNGTVTIYCTGELDELERVEVDGVEVDKSNYTLVEGSTILTFNASYLDTLAPGEHTVKLIYTGDRSVVTTLAITEKVVVDDNTTADDDTDDEVSNDADDNSIAAPDVDASATPTGDSNHLTLWMILAIAAFTGAAICGIMYRKKLK